MLNQKGIQYILNRTHPLAVNSMDKAEAVMLKAITDRAEATKKGNVVCDNAAFARHLAWLIGFDRLVEDRADIHHIVEKLS